MDLFDAVQISPAYIASGMVVGALVGLTGVGGGALMTPLLVLLFGINPATAVGTDLLYAAVTKFTGTMVHGANHTVDWRITLRLATGSVPAAMLTLALLAFSGIDLKAASGTITTILGIALILTAVTLLFRTVILKLATKHVGEIEAGRTAFLTIATGALLGVLVSLSSIGAGAIGVTILLILYPRLPVARIVGSDIAHAVPLTLVAGLGHWMLGSVNGSLLVSLLLGSLPGITIGSYLAPRIPEKVLRAILAGTLTVVGGRLLG